MSVARGYRIEKESELFQSELVFKMKPIETKAKLIFLNLATTRNVFWLAHLPLHPH